MSPLFHTGASDGKRDYDKLRTVRKSSSGASLGAEKKYQKQQARKAAAKARREEKRRNR